MKVCFVFEGFLSHVIGEQIQILNIRSNIACTGLRWSLESIGQSISVYIKQFPSLLLRRMTLLLLGCPFLIFYKLTQFVHK